MKVSEAEADLFFELMWSLQYFVNSKERIIPSVKTLKKYTNLPMEEKLKVRNALFENAAVIDDFVRENPEKLSEEKLKIVSGWKNFVAGKFYIERLLKKYAVFISGEKVYGVLGLYQGLDEIIHPSYLPVLVEATLLPFKGRVIYDGIVIPYNVAFGSGIRADLKDTYMEAKRDGAIIVDLNPG